MTNIRKSIRFLTVLALVFAMIFSIASVSASAAGSENWYISSSYIWENPFSISGYNLTPTKTCCANGTLNITANFLSIEDLGTNPFNFHLQIRNANGTVLAQCSGCSADFASGLPQYLYVSCPVNYGQKVQIYIDAYDTITGNYRIVKVNYAHLLST